MGIKESLVKAREERKKVRAERNAFAKVVKKRELQARRQAFEKEALIQADIKGRRLAQERAARPTFSQRVGQAATGIGRLAEQATRPPVRKAPVKRRKRRVVRRRAPIRRRRRRTTTVRRRR